MVTKQKLIFGIRLNIDLMNLSITVGMGYIKKYPLKKGNANEI